MSESLFDLLQQRFGEDFNLDPELAANPLLVAQANHRSCRKFAERDVGEDTLRALFACAFTAPAKSDLQQACVVRVADPAKRARLDSLLASMPWVASAPVMLVICGDNRRIRRICEMRGKPFANAHFDSFFNASVDAGLILMNLIRAVEAVGLGCCPLSQIRNDAAAVVDLLDLPQHVFPVAGLVIGHPAERAMISARLPLDVTVHVDSYRDDQLEQQVERYDTHRIAVQGQTAEHKQRQVKRFGVAERYGWSEDKARQVSVSERESFGALVRAQGFELD